MTKLPRLMTDDEIRAERRRLGIPDGLAETRAWIRYQLQQKDNPATGKKFNQADIAKAAGVSKPTVSIVLAGNRPLGRVAERVREVTADLLGIRKEVLFGRSLRQELENRRNGV